MRSRSWKVTSVILRRPSLAGQRTGGDRRKIPVRRVLMACRASEGTDAFRRMIDALDESRRHSCHVENARRHRQRNCPPDSAVRRVRWPGNGDPSASKLLHEVKQAETPHDRPPVHPRDPPTFIRRHTDVSFPARVRQGKIHNLRLQIIPAETVLPSGEVVPVAKPHVHDDYDHNFGYPSRRRRRRHPSVKITASIAAENFELLRVRLTLR